ncbi:ComEC/Rec2 family competence protein [Tropicimonas sp. S265A]|uniref:ComEC/Rec2 family competence protein n=1 Tax=Tropicimonas sp. S265A TaxID=3415134 RepID=UPI003C7B5C16
MTLIVDLRRALFPWLPVLLGVGALAYFIAPAEPPPWAVPGLLVLGGMGVVFGLGGPWRARPVALFIGMLALGYGLAAERTARLAAPVLEYRYYGPVEGRLVEIDRSYGGALRLTLDRVRLENTAPHRTPHRVRLSLHGDQGFVSFEPGQQVMTTAHLSPPAAPAEPGGFDFRRHAWFERLGAVGYTRVPVLLWAEPERTGLALKIYRFRLALSAGIQARIPSQPGAFAAAILTGDRAGIDSARVEDLRATNLAHLLAISGLHMGLLTGTMFLILRTGIAAIPWLALRVPEKKVAAVGALIAAASYLVISGAAVATERAFIMVAMMLIAVLVDRRAISLRSVAWAALIVLMMRPEAVMGPGFQMSFAATTALVVAYNALRDWPPWQAVPRWARGPVSLLFTSFVAGAATAPIAAATFNIIAHYGLIANLASVSVMGMVVMPGAIFALFLLPFGLDWVPLMATEYGIRWILWVASTIAGWEGAVGRVPRPQGWVLGLILGGGILAALGPWRAVRIAGLAPAALALALWTQVERPALLVTETGGLLGLLTPEGRVLSRPRGDGFSARVWLENDGDGVDQAAAAARAGLVIDGMETVLDLDGTRIVQLRGKTGLARYTDVCAQADLVILNKAVDRRGACQTFDIRDLRKTGALALAKNDGVLTIEKARADDGTRLWTGGAGRDSPVSLMVQIFGRAAQAAP